MLSLVLASSLWLASSQAGARPDAVAALVPVEQAADEFASDLAWIVGTHALDLYTTAWALHRNERAYEGNPLGPTAETRLALKVASTMGAGLIVWKLRRSGHANWARAVRWGTVGINVALAANNTVRAVR